MEAQFQKSSKKSFQKNKMKLFFENNTDIKLKKKEFKKIAEKVVLKLKKSQRAEIGLHLINDAQIKKLNKKYREVNQPTDVLSFPLERIEEKTEGPHQLGDIFISVDTAKRNSATFNLPLEKEIKHLFTHGLLHLLGYDHERNEKEWEKAILITDN